MNTSKLHVMAKVLVEDLQRCKTVNLLQQTSDSLQQLTRQPNQPSFQDTLSKALTDLYQRLENSVVEEFSPAWQETMKEMGIEREFGLALKDELKGILERNQITHQVAFNEMNSIATRLKATDTHLKAVVGAFDYFGIGGDELERGECEVGITIPRRYVDNNLLKFGKELEDLEKMLRVFSEIAGESRPQIKIRSISSSELSVFLDYGTEIAAFIAIAVERSVALYKNILEIKKAKSTLEKNNMDKNVLKAIEDSVTASVAPRLDEIAHEIIKIKRDGKGSNEDRDNELLIELRRSLNMLLNRIDRGVNIEMRTSEKEEDPGDEEQETEQGIALSKIREAAKAIEFLKVPEEPLLFLSEGNNHTTKKPKK